MSHGYLFFASLKIKIFLLVLDERLQFYTSGLDIPWYIFFNRIPLGNNRTMAEIEQHLAIVGSCPTLSL